MDELWYASYGSNMALDRLTCYLAGGRPPGAARTYPGARDASPPRDIRPVQLRGCVYFAWESPTWRGGIAFYDPAAPGTSVGRAYLLSLSQLSDVAAQEMRRSPGVDLDLTDLLAQGSSVLGPGRYESLHVVGRIDDAPVVTFTAPWQAETAQHNPPVAAYLVTMARGLVEGQGWTPDEVIRYLLARPGIGPGWDRAALEELLDGAQPESQRGSS